MRSHLKDKRIALPNWIRHALAYCEVVIPETFQARTCARSTDSTGPIEQNDISNTNNNKRQNERKRNTNFECLQRLQKEGEKSLKGELERACSSDRFITSLYPHTSYTTMDSFATFFTLTSNTSESEPIHSAPIDADGNGSPGTGCIVV